MTALVFAIVLGIAVACFGAWKDTLWETFQWRAFLRTPILTTGWSLVLLLSVPDSHWFLMGISAVALERFTIELSKLVTGEMPSKFLRPARDVQWLRTRIRQARRAMRPKTLLKPEALSIREEDPGKLPNPLVRSSTQRDT